MEDNSGWMESLRQRLTSLKEKLEEQPWYQELKTKWEELDTRTRLSIKVGAGSAGALLILILALSFVWKVKGLKNEISEKNDLLTLLQSANEEIRQLRSETGGASLKDRRATSWPSELQNLAASAGIEPSGIEVGSEKPGAVTPTSKESLLDVKLKHINIRQLVRYAFAIENRDEPMKVRNLLIETQDSEGYLNATLAISAFEIKGS